MARVLMHESCSVAGSELHDADTALSQTCHAAFGAPGDEPDPAKILDLAMLVVPGGEERSQEEYRVLLEKAGFHREGTLRAHCKTHGERHDRVMFSLVATDLRPD